MESLRFRLRVFTILLFVILILGVIGFMKIEGFSLPDALYFIIVTVATVGYGDIHPESPLGKILAIFLIIAGVGTFLGVVANATEMLLNRRENQARMQKLHVVIGVFFSEVGTQLLNRFAHCDPNLERLQSLLRINAKWSEKEFLYGLKNLNVHKFEVNIDKDRLEDLRDFLARKGEFLLRLLENPALLEHEAFTELLWAVFHFREELLSREVLSGLPDTDYAHLAGDIIRAYRLLIVQWLRYMNYLKGNYPYLFSLAMRTNPFNPEASPIVQ